MAKKKPPELTFQQHIADFLARLEPGAHYDILPFNSTCDKARSLAAAVSQEMKTKLALVPKISDQDYFDHKIDTQVQVWIDSLRVERERFVEGAFRTVFEPPRGAAENWVPPFQEIIFIASGDPTDAEGNKTDTDELIRRIVVYNLPYRIPIRCIGFSDGSTRFMEDLQEVGGGGKPAMIE